MKRLRSELADFHRQVLMDDMMQVVGVDLLDVVDVDGGQSYLQARSNCHACTRKSDCRDWLAEVKTEPEHQQPQAFCPNASLFRAVKR
jgi:hypothetical protein